MQMQRELNLEAEPQSIREQVILCFGHLVPSELATGKLPLDELLCLPGKGPK